MGAALEAPCLAAVRWRPFRLPLRARFQAAHATLEERAGVLVQVVDADGAAGIGEASPLPSLGGGTVDDVLALLERHAAALLESGSVPECAGAAALRCALDVALLDLEGRRRGVPVARLLTETPARDVEVNAVIGGGPPSHVARYGAEAVAAGYRVLKLKAGVARVDEDIARVQALRASCPEAGIRLDANGAWDEATARAALEACAGLGVELVEQPVPAADVEALARLRAAGVPLAADEAAATAEAAARVVEGRAADYLVLKPMLLGGVQPALDVARRAAAAGIGSYVTTTFDSSVGTAAALQLAAALPAGGPAHGLSTGEHLAADAAARTLVPSAGRMAVPEAPGLGVEVDEAALEAVATGPWREVRL